MSACGRKRGYRCVEPIDLLVAAATATCANDLRSREAPHAMKAALRPFKRHGSALRLGADRAPIRPRGGTGGRRCDPGSAAAASPRDLGLEQQRLRQLEPLSEEVLALPLCELSEVLVDQLRAISPAGLPAACLPEEGGQVEPKRRTPDGRATVAAVALRSDRYRPRWRLGFEWSKFGVVWADVAIGGFGYLVPDAGYVAERFGDDQPRVV